MAPLKEISPDKSGRCSFHWKQTYTEFWSHGKARPERNI